MLDVELVDGCKWRHAVYDRTLLKTAAQVWDEDDYEEVLLPTAADNTQEQNEVASHHTVYGIVSIKAIGGVSHSVKAYSTSNLYAQTKNLETGSWVDCHAKGTWEGRHELDPDSTVTGIYGHAYSTSSSYIHRTLKVNDTQSTSQVLVEGLMQFYCDGQVLQGKQMNNNWDLQGTVLRCDFLDGWMTLTWKDLHEGEGPGWLLQGKRRVTPTGPLVDVPPWFAVNPDALHAFTTKKIIDVTDTIEMTARVNPVENDDLDENDDWKGQGLHSVAGTDDSDYEPDTIQRQLVNSYVRIMDIENWDP